ncbi:MAG: CpaF family protein, partial [Candidatus Omnitrophica bacterium]|nr:CpaF family protein [Candidatus Omnitrophota bacterium]
ARMPDGCRKIVQITELAGMKDEMHININDIFKFKGTGIDAKGTVLGEFTATGYIPLIFEDIKIKGIPLNEDIFKKSSP